MTQTVLLAMVCVSVERGIIQTQGMCSTAFINAVFLFISSPSFPELLWPL